MSVTLPESRSAGAPSESEPGASEAPPRPLPIRRAVILTVGVLLTLALAWWLVEDPIAHVWYNARQDHRAASFLQPRKATAPGQSLAVLQIPAINLNLTVVEGDRVDLLRGGPGHEPGTPRPGEIGNSIIVGHRKGWGGPFAHLGQLQPGATVAVRLHGQSTVLLFTVTSVRRVGPGDTSLLARSDDRRLTLVTTDGGRFASSGYLVVSAVSGNPGTLGHRLAGVRAAPRRGSPLFNRDMATAFVRAALAAAIILLLRRRYRAGVVAALATPLVLAALLSLTLGLDRTLPPLG
jgi:LPXTG-site transpeptidase (sortase) family protein